MLTAECFVRGWRRVFRGQRLTLRVSLADVLRAQGLLETLPSLTLPHLRTAPCSLERFPTLTSDDPDILQASWASLADAPLAEKLRVWFETLTAFKHQPRINAAHLLKSWRDAWAWAPESERPTEMARLTPEDLWVDDAGL